MSTQDLRDELVADLVAAGQTPEAAQQHADVMVEVLKRQIPDLSLQREHIVLCDERHRQGKPMGVTPGKVASITLCSSDGNESWGEFLDADDVRRAADWFARLARSL